MSGLSAGTKNVAVVERWLLVEVRLYYVTIYSNVSVFNSRPSSAAFECLRAFVLHLLDTEWKVCDGIQILRRYLSIEMLCQT